VTTEEEVVDMRTVVDLTRCQGYAQCVFLAPEVFELHGEEGLLLPHLGSARLVEDPPPDRQNAMLRGPRHLSFHL
jgi:ferredoxin